MKQQIKRFDDYQDNVLQSMNEFMETVEVIDVKMNTVVSPGGPFFSSYLVFYKEES